jgi:hypothetical protein
MRKYAAGRSPALPPTVSKTALPVGEQSGHAGAVTGIGVQESFRSPRRDCCCGLVATV